MNNDRKGRPVTVWLSDEDLGHLDAVRIGLGAGSARPWAVQTRSAMVRYLVINEAIERGIRVGAVMRTNGTLVECKRAGMTTKIPNALAVPSPIDAKLWPTMPDRAPATATVVTEPQLAAAPAPVAKHEETEEERIYRLNPFRPGAD